MSKKKYEFWSDGELRAKIDFMTGDAALYIAEQVFQSVGCFYSRWIFGKNSRKMLSHIRSFYAPHWKNGRENLPILTKRNIKYSLKKDSYNKGKTTAKELAEYIARTRSGLAASRYIQGARQVAAMRGKSFRKITWSSDPEKLRQAYKLSNKKDKVTVAKKGKKEVTMHISLKYIEMAYSDAPFPNVKKMEAAACNRWAKMELKRNLASKL